MQAAQRQPSQQITDARMLSRMQQQRRPLLPTCTSLTGRPGKRCCAAASASASSLPTTQRSMCSLGAPGLPRASASSSAAAASMVGAGQGHEQDERARLRRSMQFSCWTYRGVQLVPKHAQPHQDIRALGQAGRRQAGRRCCSSRSSSRGSSSSSPFTHPPG